MVAVKTGKWHHKRVGVGVSPILVRIFVFFWLRNFSWYIADRANDAVFILLATSIQNILDITTAAGITGDRTVGHTCDHLLHADWVLSCPGPCRDVNTCRFGDTLLHIKR